MHYLNDLFLLLFVMVAMTAFGAKYLIDWSSGRDEHIRTNAYTQGYLRKHREECEYDEGYLHAKEKYEAKTEEKEEDF